MKIAVDLTPVLPGGENGGAKLLTLNLVEQFRDLAPQHRFILLTHERIHGELAYLDSANISRQCILTCSGPVPQPRHYWPLNRIASFTRSLAPGLDRKDYPLPAHGVDLLFCPFSAPTYAVAGIPAVSIIYDLQHREYPYFFSARELIYRERYYSEICRKTSRCVCISSHTRDNLIRFFKMEKERTRVIFIGIHSRLRQLSMDERQGTLESLGLHKRPFVYYPANFWPHKNHRMLLAAYSMFLCKNPGSDLDLALTGTLEVAEKSLKSDVEAMGLGARVHFLGYLPEEKLAAVWQGSTFLVFPSLYEGFGIPVVEAMFFGKPVACSNVTSLPEVGGDAVLYFDPRKPAEIVRCMERILFEPGLKERLVKRGKERCRLFDPENITRQYLSVFEEAVRLSTTCVSL